MIRESWFCGRKTPGFTLQWHLTNACPFHCTHCYDRQDRGCLELPQALVVLEDFQSFCRNRRVVPHIALSGGDPLAYPHFWALYEAIAAAGVRTTILGNPLRQSQIKRLMSIQAPGCYQVSLEGGEAHNDSVRGKGHFARTLRFLEEARPLRLNTHVMLTLTHDNMSQVLGLADSLRGLVSRFTFNRLSQVGHGAALKLPSPGEYSSFLRQYLAAARNNPTLHLKENLFGILAPRLSRRSPRGCTGHGCGAAFDFVALLPDGQVHACRKFPSPIGNILASPLGAIYQSEAARQYREGPSACLGCPLRPHCRGCMAVTHGQGLDPLRDRDPFCFINIEFDKRPATTDCVLRAEL